MGWLGRLRPSVPDPSNDAQAGTIIRPAPGIAALFESVGEDQSHAVLDLGPASEAGLRLYSRFARRVRFVDLADPSSRASGSFAPGDLPAQPEHPYDLIFTWDALGRLEPDERPKLVERLVEISATSARLHVLIGASEEPGPSPRRFTAVGPGQMSYELSGPVVVLNGRIFPADVERVLRPFEVVRAFTLMEGLREYVAQRTG